MELTIEQALQQGVAAHNAGNLQEAERVYQAILQSQPKHPDANHNLGLIAVSVNKAGAALPLFKTALEANPKIEQFWLSYIDALIKEKQFENAKKVLEQGKEQGVAGEKLNALEAQLASTNQTKDPNLPEQETRLILVEKRKEASARKKKKRENANSLRPSQQQLSILVQHYQNRQYGEAEKLAISITEQFPKNEYGWKILGAVLAQTGRISEAINANQRAVQLAPQHAEAHSNLGVALQELGRLDEAEASYRQAIALKSGYAEAHYNLGITLQKLGRLDEAEASYNQAIALKPDSAEAHSNLGNTLQELGRLDEAEASYNQAIALKPDFSDAHNNLGAMLKEMGRLEEAEVSLRQAIAVKPGYAEAHSNLGTTLKELGKLDEAQASYTQAIALKSDFAEAHYNLGKALKELGRLDEAEASYNQAIALKPNYAEAHYNLGKALKELGRLDKAEASYNQAIALKSGYAEAHSNLGITLKELGRLDKAEASLRQAIALKPDYAEAHSNLGNTLKKLGRLDEAEASLRQAITLKPDLAEAHNNLGNTIKELGRLDEAKASLRQAIVLKPDYVDAARNLVKLPVGQLDSDALNLCEKAFDVLDDSPEYQIKYFFFQGNLLKHRGFIEQSFNVFCKANKLKLEVSKDRMIVDAKKNIDSLMRIDKWMPNPPELAGKRLAKLFIMGPSKSGKSSLEHILSASSHVKTLYETIKHNELIKNDGCGKDSSELLFENLFSQSEGKLFYQGYKVVTSTNPGSIFYSDYLMDMLPTAYFIIVKRDLRDVSPEIFTSEYNSKNLYSYDANEISKYLDVYNRVCETLALKVPDRCLTVSFEDIIRAPEDVVDEISRLVGSSLRVNHLKRNAASFECESLFRNHYATLSNESKY